MISFKYKITSCASKFSLASYASAQMANPLVNSGKIFDQEKVFN